MKVEDFNIDDIDTINDWLTERKLPRWEKETFPECNFAVRDEFNEIVAMVSLRVCEGDIGIVENLATDPLCSPEDRHRALDMIISKIIEFAKECDLTSLLGFTFDKSVVKRAMSHGFIESPSTTIILNLEGEIQ